MAEPKFYPPEQLSEFCQRTFEHFGVPTADAKLAAGVLAMSDIRGVDSHGVARLRTYIDMLSLGRINPKANVKIIRQLAATATIDGDNGLGLVVGPKANDICLEKADQVGSAVVSVSNTNHYGIAAYYVIKALERGLIGWTMTNTAKLVAPLWGAERMLGTNPLAIAFPCHAEPPVVIDLATSATAYGKIEIAKRKNAEIPAGWAIDKDGHMANRPEQMIEGGALLPLGSTRELGGHKGFGLGAMVDILSGVLSGANWGPYAPPFAKHQEIPNRSVGKGIGHCFGAMRIDGFIDPDEFKRQMDDWVRTMRATKPAPGTPGVVIPGSPEWAIQHERAKTGIPLLPAVVKDLIDISQQTGVPFE